MRWPWVSRERYEELKSERDRLRERPHRETVEQVRDERDRLREQVDQLQDNLTRIKRAQAGLSETPRPDRPQRKPMPTDLREYIDAFGNPSIRKQMRDECLRAHARGRPWNDIKDEVLGDEEPEPVEYR